LSKVVFDSAHDNRRVIDGVYLGSEELTRHTTRETLDTSAGIDSRHEHVPYL
jgi:hypothetical protein